MASPACWPVFCLLQSRAGRSTGDGDDRSDGGRSVATAITARSVLVGLCRAVGLAVMLPNVLLFVLLRCCLSYCSVLRRRVAAGPAWQQAHTRTRCCPSLHARRGPQLQGTWDGSGTLDGSGGRGGSPPESLPEAPGYVEELRAQVKVRQGVFLHPSFTDILHSCPHQHTSTTVLT